MASREPLVVRLRQAFLEDLEEQLRAMNADLLALEAGDAAPERLKSLFRAAHTLKGAARAASLPTVEQLCHALEETLSRAREGTLALGPGHFRLLFATADALAATGRTMRAGSPPDPAALAPLTAALQFGDLPDLPGAPSAALPPTPAAPPEPAGAGGSGESGGSDGSSSVGSIVPAASTDSAASTPSLGSTDGAPSIAPPPVASPSITSPSTVSTSTVSPTTGSPAAPPVSGDAFLRVDAEKLDALLASVEQLLLIRAGLEARLPEAETLREDLARSARRGAGAAANGAGRRESDAARERARDAGRLADGLSADLRALAQVTDELAERARGMRMRPFAEACEALPRTVRDVAAASGKEARLVVVGQTVEADRAVIDAVREALLHLVRNAVDHGIEPPEERERMGKPRAGTVSVAAALRGERVMVSVADDGRGLDIAAVRAKLARQGRAVPEDDREVARALFESGVSTQETATAISGRGVGLDAARAAMARVRGTARVEWHPGAGTTFVLECPLTLATVRALLVRVDGHAFAIPTAGVRRLARVDPAELRRAEDREVVLSEAGPVPIVPLARLLGPPLVERAVSGPFPAVHLRSGDHRLAVAVDEPEGERELVVRPLPRGRSPLPHFSGAALLGTGEVALVLDVGAVVASGLAAGAGAGMRVETTAEAVRRRVLVVDDSITTRTLEQSTLEAAGFEVRTAVDGEDGWRALQEHGADLVVSDVEMPRMDGFELCATIRASQRFAGLPVILVTSLESPEHRARGLDAGADAYVGKSGFDQEDLLATIRRLLGDG